MNRRNLQFMPKVLRGYNRSVYVAGLGACAYSRLHKPQQHAPPESFEMVMTSKASWDTSVLLTTLNPRFNSRMATAYPNNSTSINVRMRCHHRR